MGFIEEIQEEIKKAKARVAYLEAKAELAIGLASIGEWTERGVENAIDKAEFDVGEFLGVLYNTDTAIAEGEFNSLVQKAKALNNALVAARTSQA